MRYRPSAPTIGQAAYETYAKATDNRSVHAEELPAWADLTTPVRNGWQLAAEAVRHLVENDC